MAFYSYEFRKGDIVKCLEDISAPLYNYTFLKNHKFKVIGLESSGLILEDMEYGLLVKKAGFIRFKVHEKEQDYLTNRNSGWSSTTPN